MKPIEIKMPALKSDGSPIMLCRWAAQPGDRIGAGDVLFEAEASKTVSEIEADAPMRLTALLCEEGDEVEPGAVIALAEAEAEPEDADADADANRADGLRGTAAGSAE